MWSRRKKISLTIFTSHFIAGVRKVCVGFYSGASLSANITAIFWPLTLIAVPLCLSCSSDAQPEPWGPLCWVLAFFIASYQHLLCTPNSIGVPEGPIGCVWLSLAHLDPTVWNSTGNSTGPLGVELNWNRNSIQLARRTQLSYIIVRRPHDLWNRMFNHHQAEITVMQFRGHSLPGHHSVVYYGNFLARPISSANFRPRDFLSLLPLECVTSFRCITLNGIFGRVKRSKHNNCRRKIVYFLWLMAYQPLWVILYQVHPCRRTIVYFLWLMAYQPMWLSKSKVILLEEK